MSFATTHLQRLHLLSRRLAHPLVESFLPVTYTSAEVEGRKRRLDPTRARNKAEANTDTDQRMMRMASFLGINETQTQRFIDEARRVRLLPPPPRGIEPDLASPMCREDQYSTYVTTRATAPSVVVETGVAHGVSSACILAAMEAGGDGTLTSIELCEEPRIGQVVPHELRSRWTLRFGHSLDVLPGVLADLGSIDMFVHDSWHGCRHVTREFELVWPYLTPGGIVCAHDILNNNAFPRFVRRHTREIDAWIENVNFGVLRKRR